MESTCTKRAVFFISFLCFYKKINLYILYAVLLDHHLAILLKNTEEMNDLKM